MLVNLLNNKFRLLNLRDYDARRVRKLITKLIAGDTCFKNELWQSVCVSYELSRGMTVFKVKKFTFQS